MSAALRYHRATNVAAGETDEVPLDPATRPAPFRDYGNAERLPLETSIAGPLLQAGAGIVRSTPGRDYGGGTIHWRAYSSAGALFPVEAVIAAPDGLYSFDVLDRALVRTADGDARLALARAAGVTELADSEAIVALVGIHARTGWKYAERGYRHVWWDAGTMLANLLALAAADDLRPRLFTAFVDQKVNALLGVDGTFEYALALLGLGSHSDHGLDFDVSHATARASLPHYPLAEAAHAAGALVDADAVLRCRTEPDGDEPRLAREELLGAIVRRRSARKYARASLPRDRLAELLAWSEAPIPVDAPRVVRQLVTVAAVDGLEPGLYDAQLNLLASREEDDLREAVAFAAMEQDFTGAAAANVFQLADLDTVVSSLGDRGYRWAELEAGIRAGRLQVGAFMRGFGAAASTFYDEEVSRLLDTHEAPMLMVAIGPL